MSALPDAPQPNAASLVLDAALHYGPRVALEHGERRLTYAQLRHTALRHAAAITPGERVGVLAANSVELVVAWLAVLAGGATLVPLSTASPAAELERRLQHARLDRVIADRPTPPGTPAWPLTRFAVSGLEAAQAGALPAPRTPQVPALLLSTSGTSGEPRWPAVSHGSLYSHTRALSHTLGLGPLDRIAAVLPLSHSYGARTGLLAGLGAGATLVLPTQRPSLAWMHDEGISWLAAVPTQFAEWANTPPGGPRPPLRWALSAGAPLPRGVLLRAEQALGCEIREAYGLTEASIATVNAPPGPRVAGAVGRPVGDVEVRIHQPGAHGEGEIQLRGANVMLGYHGDEGGSRDMFTADGWLRSGDVGRLLNGELVVVDRLRDIILRGGNTLYPAELEAALSHTPGVLAAAVVPHPHPHYGEVQVAVIEATADFDEAQARAYLATQLASYKLPERFVRVLRLPVGPTGKLSRRLARALVVGAAEPTSG